MTKKKIFTGLLIIALLVLFGTGVKDHVERAEHLDIVVPAGVIDEGSSSVNDEIQPAEAAINTETPPVAVPVSIQTEVEEPSDVKDANEEDEQLISTPEEGHDPVPVVPAPEEPHEEHQDPSVHEHTWVDEIGAYHEAVTHIEHHDAATEERWVSAPVLIQHFYCDVCHMEFSSQADAYAHEDATYQAAIEANDMSLIHAGHYSVEEYIDQGYYETVVIREAYDETVIDQPAWEEHIFRCSVCGATA
ncbi:MAG: hypothetical protein IJI78_08045 [Oscillospiraceae bacterium]|nr:hypothetical protein [Oscillospiraceae bacterium]